MRILCYILVVLFVTTTAVGQQINPVPDYIFRNSMSVGRNAPTDTSAYFSIGPRFGATRGFMPPMVVDTAAVTGTKRNGLLIYSIQRNSFLYWDSTGSRWSRIAANLDTLQLATRAWRQKGIDSVASVRIGGSGVTGYIPKFTAARTLDSSQMFQSNGLIGIGTATPTQRLVVNGSTIVGGTSVSGFTESAATFGISGTHQFAGQTTKGISRFNWVNNTGGDTVSMGVRLQLGTYNGHTTNMNTAPFIGSYLENISNGYSGLAFGTSTGSQQERMRIFSNGRVAINTTTDDGYQFMVNGTALISGTVNGVFTNQIRNTGQTGAVNLVGLNFATYDGSAVSQGTFLGEYANSWTYISSTFANSSFISGSKANGLSLAATNANGYMRFFTGGNTDGIPTNERMRIFANGRVAINSSTDAGYQFDVAGSMRNTTDAYFNTTSGETYIGTTSDAGAFKLQVNGVAYAVDGLRTGNPTGGTAATWKLGTVASVSPTSPNRTIEVDIGGTIYYIHAKTTND